jgi:ubiquinone/menaquinone biosynthesis C-methylase UbiE
MSNAQIHPADDLIARLDAADRLPGAARLRAASYDLLGARPGASVVDVGCGGGRAVAELRDRGVRAVGVDPNARMIAVARGRWPDADFRLGDAYALPLDDGSADGYRAHKVFHELADPERALAEARRVLRPRGRIVLLGHDWDTFVVDSDYPSLTRAIVHARADQVTAPRAARRHRNLLLDAGFADVATDVRTIVVTGPQALPLLTALAEAARAADAVTGDQAATWLADQRSRAETDRLYLAVPTFLATATR